MSEIIDDRDKGRILLEIAGESVAYQVLGTPEEDHHKGGWLLEPGATFVTLHLGGALRGCLGSLHARDPLMVDLRHNARAAASRDPRFPPLTPDELDSTEIEVSLLSALEEVLCDSEEDAIRHMSFGLNGWLLSHRGQSGTFLPQVWEALPEPREFFRRLKEKAGLAAGWEPKTRLWRYTVSKWSSR